MNFNIKGPEWEFYGPVSTDLTDYYSDKTRYNVEENYYIDSFGEVFRVAINTRTQKVYLSYRKYPTILEMCYWTYKQVQEKIGNTIVKTKSWIPAKKVIG